MNKKLAINIINVCAILFLNRAFGQPIAYKDTVRLRHLKTGKYLAAGRKEYTHCGASRQNAVYAIDKHCNYSSQRWVIKGSHGFGRWNCCSGVTIKQGDTIRLEHCDTFRNLHSHYGVPSPSTCQQEVTTYVKHAYDCGIGDYNDNWIVDAILGPCGFGSILRNGCAVKLRHEASSHMLHSHECYWFLPGKQEVTAYSHCDDNDWFIVECEGQETCNTDYANINQTECYQDDEPCKTASTCVGRLIGGALRAFARPCCTTTTCYIPAQQCTMQQQCFVQPQCNQQCSYTCK